MCTKGDKVMLYQDDKKLNPHAEEITLKKNDEVSITMQGGRRIFTCEIIPFREFLFVFYPSCSRTVLHQVVRYMTFI